MDRPGIRDEEPITSLTNPQVKLVHALLDTAGRRRHGAYLVEGLRLVEAASQTGQPQLVLHLPGFGIRPGRERRLLHHLRALGVPVRAVDERVLAHVTDTVTPQGIAAVMPLPAADAWMARPGAHTAEVPATSAPSAGPAEVLAMLAASGALAGSPSSASTAPLVLVLDAIADPGNAGTLLRSAAGAGVTHVLAARGCVDLYSPKVVRAGAGAHFSLALATGLSWTQVGEYLDLLRAGGGIVILADAAASRPYWDVDWTVPATLIISNEAHGASAEARAMASEMVAIPIQDIESLNAGVAGSVILFEALRQRALVHGLTPAVVIAT